MSGVNDQRHGTEDDIERLERALAACQDLQDLAYKYGINDIFQDNGGKVLQTLILLGLHTVGGRAGNDAIDDDGNEYELKTVNIASKPNQGITTHHHLNHRILAKYRAVKAWYIALYNGIILDTIYRLTPEQLEVKFKEWEDKINARPGLELNNPKIPMWFVRQHGEVVYPSPEHEQLELDDEDS